MIHIFIKELTTYFGTITAYMVSAIFVAVTALFLFFFDNEFNVFNLGTASLETFFFIAPWAFMFLIPALTMRLIAEEKQIATFDWLMTQPLKVKDILLGKYLATLMVIVFMLVVTWLYPYIIKNVSLNNSLDYGTVCMGYIGLMFLGFFFAAIGLLISAIAQNQIIAYVASVFICFVMYYGFNGLASYNLMGGFDYYVQQMGATYHYQSFLRGVFDTRDFFYFFAGIVLILTLAHYLLHKNQSK